MSTTDTSLFFPFIAKSANRNEPVSKEMEMAVVFCVTELERQKGGGLIIRQTPEKIGFISKAMFPLILVDWNEKNLVFDALSTVNHTIRHKVFPDTKALLDNIEDRSKTQESFTAFLFQSMERLKEPMNEKTITFNGLIGNRLFLEELDLYLSEAKPIDFSDADLITMPKILDEDAIESAKQKLANLEVEFGEELENLHSSMKLFSKFTNTFIKTIQADITHIHEMHSEEIKKQESMIKPAVKKLRDELDKQTTAISRDFDKQSLLLQKEKIKLEKSILQIEKKIERYKTGRKAASIEKDRIAEKQWKEKMDKTKPHLSELKKKKNAVEAKIIETEKNKTLELLKTRSENDTRVTEIEKPIFELEVSRDAETSFRKDQIEKLQSMNSKILEQINVMIELRKENVVSLKKLGIRHFASGLTTAYIPFYLACFQSEKSRRYKITVPSMAQSVGLSVKLKGALGRPRIMGFLLKRFEVISSFLDNVSHLLRQDPSLEEDIHGKGEETNMLESKPSREQIKQGLKQFLDEGWVSDKEHLVFVRLLS